MKKINSIIGTFWQHHEFLQTYFSRLKKNLEDPLQFFIKSNDPAVNQIKILCLAETKESKNKWFGILKCQLQTQVDMHLAFEDSQPFLFALLKLGLTQNLEFVFSGVVGLDKELQGILSSLVQCHFVQLNRDKKVSKVPEWHSLFKGKSHNRKTLRFHEFFWSHSQKIVKLLCYRHAEIFFGSNHRLKRSEWQSINPYSPFCFS